MSKTFREKIVGLFGDGSINKSALSIRDGAGVFEQVLSGKGIKTVLEIGTYRGVSAAEMSKYCDKVITIDLEEGQLERTDIGFSRKNLWRALGIENIELILVKNNEEKKKVIDSLQFDFAFVDGDHGEGVRLDWDLVKRCGNVLFHDYDTSGRPHLSHVFNLVNQLPKEEVTIIDIFAHWKKK